MDIIVAMSNSTDFDENIFKKQETKNYIFKYTKKGFYEELNNLKTKNNNLKIIIFKKLNEEDEFNLFELKELKNMNLTTEIVIILEDFRKKDKDLLTELTSYHIDNIIFYRDLKDFNLDKIFKITHIQLLEKLKLKENLLNEMQLKEIYRQILNLENKDKLRDYTKELLLIYDSKTLEYIIKNAPKKIKNQLKNDKNMLFLYPKENIFTLMAEKILNYKNFKINKNKIKNKNSKKYISSQKIYLVFSNNSCGSTEIASNFAKALEKIHKNKKIALIDLDFFEHSCSYNFTNNNKDYTPFIVDISNKKNINSKEIHYFKSKNLYFYTNILKDEINIDAYLSEENLLNNFQTFINILLMSFDYIIIDFSMNINFKLIKYLINLNTIKLLVIDENLKNLCSLKEFLIKNQDIFRYYKFNIVINKYREYIKLKDLNTFIKKDLNFFISSFIKIPYEEKINKYKLQNKTVYEFSDENFKKAIENIYYKST